MFKKYLEYIQDNPKRYWFKAKWFGWGWVPATWEGWLVLLVYVALVVYFASTTLWEGTLADVVRGFILPITFFAILLVLVSYRKGEKPGWRWGSEDTKKKGNKK